MPDPEPRHRLVVDFTELLVDELESVLRIIEADALRHRGDGMFEALAEGAGAAEPQG